MMFTVKQVAELLQVRTDLVAQFVKTGELVAIDVSLKQGKKRRLRIPEDALHQFLERRRVHVPPPRPRSSLRPKQREVIDVFAVPKLEEKGRRRLKISDVAEYLEVNEDHVRRLISDGRLTVVNVGSTATENRYRVVEKELFAFIESRGSLT